MQPGGQMFVDVVHAQVLQQALQAFRLGSGADEESQAFDMSQLQQAQGDGAAEKAGGSGDEDTALRGGELDGGDGKRHGGGPW